MIRIILIVSVQLAFFSALYSQPHADDVIGIWETPGEDNGRIEIYKSGNVYYGKIAWLKKQMEDGKPRVDKNNPDPAVRTKPVIGLNILKDFVFDGEGEWNKGDIYDPSNGKSYSALMRLEEPNKLKVRGYIGFSLLGRTEYWTRVE